MPMRHILILLFIFGCSSLSALPWLKAGREHVVDEKEQAVILRGVNLGGWLVEEMWMLPFVKESKQTLMRIRDHAMLWQVFVERFGTEKMHTIRSEFRKNWIQKSDFARIREAGLNCVRLPFLASLIDEPEGFFWLDFAIEEAANVGLYVILDMHGTFGGQSKEEHTGKADQNLLFQDEQMVKRTALTWEKIATRYKDCPTVCAYDLMNEPMGATDSKTLHGVHDAFYRAIRKVDTRHMIIMEDGYRGIRRMPDPKRMKWENVIYSSHTYVDGAYEEKECLTRFDERMKSVDTMQERYNVPYYLGEFNVKPTPEMGTILTQFIQKLQEKKRSWSLWSYKVAGRCPRGKSWGLYLRPKGLKRIDPFRDSEKRCLKKIAMLRTEHFQKNDLLIDLCQKTANVENDRTIER